MIIKNGVIAVDIDDTLADFIGPMAEFHNRNYGTNLKREDFKTYYLRNAFGCELDEAIKRVDRFIEDGLERITPFPDALDITKELSKNNRLIIVTSRREELKCLTLSWLDRNFPNVFSEVHFSHNHYTQTGGKMKHEICEEVDADIIIEDSLDYALKCCKNHKVFLYDSPWNQRDNLPEGITRVYNWKDIGRRLL